MSYVANTADTVLLRPYSIKKWQANSYLLVLVLDLVVVVDQLICVYESMVASVLPGRLYYNDLYICV